MTLNIILLLVGAVCSTAGTPEVCLPADPGGRISLAIDNIQSNQGDVHVAIYDEEEQFAKSLEPFQLKIYKASEVKQVQLQLEDFPHGRYAVAIYHDENGNGKLDKNLLGIPKEPYGFSNNPRAKWSAPTYDETSFAVNETPAMLTISLKKWKER